MSDPISDPTDGPPRSATHPAVAAAGVVSFLGATAAVRALAPDPRWLVPCAALIIAATAAGVLGTDALWQRTHRRASTGIDVLLDDPSVGRTLTKYVGLAGSLSLIGFLYWLFPEYHGAFYRRYFLLLEGLVPAWLVAAPAYLYYVDRHLREPRDGYWQFGRLLLGRREGLSATVLGQHVLGWLIKGFFLPLMFTYFCDDLARIVVAGPGVFSSLQSAFDFLYFLMYFIDVGLVSMGYLVALRLADTHLRSAEPTLLGWAAALACYEPFWSLIGAQYLAYGSGQSWNRWLAGAPVLAVVWGVLILMLTAVYVWATISFGARFSNLTHRGIITSGPYRYCRHPAYLAKNLSWWLLAVPFVVHGSWLETLRHCLLLGGLNALYALRAYTEERHLSADPDYRAYVRWIDDRYARWGWRSRGAD